MDYTDKINHGALEDDIDFHAKCDVNNIEDCDLKELTDKAIFK